MDKIFITDRFSRIPFLDLANDLFRRVQLDMKVYAFFFPVGGMLSYHFCLGYLRFNRSVTEIEDFLDITSRP
jgi:hypothetical protein